MKSYIDHYNVTVSNCRFANNRAGDEGGAIYSSSNMIIADSTFTNNTADYSGAVILYSGRNKIDNCTFTENYMEIYYLHFSKIITTDGSGQVRPMDTVSCQSTIHYTPNQSAWTMI